MKADRYGKNYDGENLELEEAELDEESVIAILKLLLLRSDEGSGISILYGYNSFGQVDVLKVRKKNSGSSMDFEKEARIYCKAGNVITDGIVGMFKKWHITINEANAILEMVKKELGKVKI